MNKKSDNIVVVGAGIVGSVQALLLARAGYSVTLIDSGKSVTTSDTGLAVRSVALSQRSRELLDSQRLWPRNAGCPIEAVHASDRGKFGAVRLTAADLDIPALGYVVSNSQLESHLISCVLDESNIELLQPANARLLNNSSESVSVQIDSESGIADVDASLLIAADGTYSKLRASLDIQTETFDYQQYAIVANLQCQRDHNNVAYERFTQSGPLALLPLAQKQMAMVYTANASDIQSLENKSDEDFLAIVQRRFGGKLGRFEAIGQRARFPLELLQSSSQTAGRAVLIGNSARTLHPVAGQGLNLALRDVFELGSQLARITDGLSISDKLAEFAKLRSADQRLVVRQTDLLARVFRQQRWPLSAPMSFFRTTAMLLLDTVPELRSRFGARNAGINVPVSNFVPD